MKNSSVTTVLAGAETWSRKWVRYELIKSFERGNGLMTLLDRRRQGFDWQEQRARRGTPLAKLYFSISSDGKSASTLYHDGSNWVSFETIDATNLPKAAKDAKKGLLSSFASAHTLRTAGNARRSSPNGRKRRRKVAGR